MQEYWIQTEGERKVLSKSLFVLFDKESIRFVHTRREFRTQYYIYLDDLFIITVMNRKRLRES